MPRLPSIFEDENFIGELSNIIKTAQAVANSNDIQLALNMINSFSGLPTGQIASDSSVSVPGGVNDKNKPGVSDLYSLDAFINYLKQNNFQYGGSPGASGIHIVTPGHIGTGEGEVHTRPDSNLIQYTSENPPKEYIINKDGLIQVLKEIANEAAKSGNLYLQELSNRLIDDVLRNGQLQVDKKIFDAQKQQIDPRAHPTTPTTAPAQVNPKAPETSKPTPTTSPIETIPVSEKTTTQVVDQVVVSVGANSLDDWLPFYPDQGIVDFNDMKFFAEGLLRLVHGNPNLASQLRRWAYALQSNMNAIENAEQQFKASAPPDMKYSSRIVYNTGVGAIEAVRDFKEQFPEASAGKQMQPGTGYDLSSEIAVAKSAATGVYYTLQLLQAITNTQLYSLPDFKVAIDLQMQEGLKLNRGLQQAATMIQGQLQNLPKTLGR